MCGWRVQYAAGCIARLFALALVAAWTPLDAAAVQTIALRGENPFGSGDDATFSTFSLPSLNNRGQVAFAAQLQGSAVSTGNDTGYWIASDGSFGTVVREGAPAPGMPAGTVFGNVSSLFIGQAPLNDAGEIAVGMSATQTSGLWIGDQQSLTLLAAQGTAAPNAENNATFGGLGGARATLNRRGDVAFSANLSGAPYTTIGNDNYHDGLWILNRGGPVATVLAATSAPAIGEQAQFFGFRTSLYPALNRSGEAAVAASHKMAPAASAILSSLWVASASGVELRATQGQSLPEIGPNATLSSFTPWGINAEGTLVASARFNNPGGTPSFGTAIMVSNSTGITLPAYSGAPAPGTAGHVFRDTFYEPSLSSNGQIAFYGSEWDGADLNTGRSGVWAGRPDDLQLIVRQGDAAPSADATFGSFFRNTPSINRFGQIAFPATLVDSQGGANTGSLWATDLDGVLTLVARVGDELEVAAGDVRTISNLTMLAKHGDDDGRPRSMNDLGQIAFSASFTDGMSGIFLSNAVAHLPGDYNGSGKVNAADYVIWRKAVATQNLIADGDRDGVVGPGDYALLREFFGQTLNLEASGVGLAAVPEPGAALLLAMLSVFLLRRWRD
jgi:hypothetical protein